MHDHWRGRLRDSIAPALFVVLPLCLFGPFTIYSGNEQEFSASFWVLVPPLILAGAGILLGLLGVGLVVPRILFRSYVALLFGLGLALWIQANFLFANYGPLDGSAIDWTLQSWRNPYEMALWIGVPVLCIAAAKYLAPIMTLVSGALVALQLAVLVVTAATPDERTRAEWRGPSDALFELSSTRNILHIVLDGFQSDLFHEILEEERERLDRSFSGAVFFADHSGAFPTTMVSIPAMLSGTVYRNEQRLETYVYDHFNKGSLFKSLKAGGYRVDSATEMHYDRASATNYFRMPRPYVSYEDYKRFTTWQLADLSLFRHVPHILRPYIFNDQDWRLQKWLGPGDTTSRRYHPVNGAVVLNEFAHRLTTATDRPLYKFLHVGIPHQPVAVNEKCEFNGVVRSSRQSYKGQTRCAVMRVASILDRLKTIGVYDNTAVIISSDHGIGYPSAKLTNDRHVPAGALGVLSAKAMALLIVKPPNSQGNVRVSYAPTTITDIPATVLDIAGVTHQLPGEPALKLPENERRVRTFAMYDWENDDWRQSYFNVLDLMEIDGRLLDGNSWKLKGSVYAPTATADSRSRGLFDENRNAEGVVYRWGSPNIYLHAPRGAKGFELGIRSISPTAQIVAVASNDLPLDQVTLANHSWYTLKRQLPRAEAGEVWISLKVTPPFKPRGGSRELGVMTRNLTWTY